MPTTDERPTRRRCRAGRGRVEDRVRPQLQDDACVSVAICVDARGVIERRRDGDADGVREKSRDRDEEQNVTRIVTVRSDHEKIRVDGQRANRVLSVRQDRSKLQTPAVPVSWKVPPNDLPDIQHPNA